MHVIPGFIFSSDKRRLVDQILQIDTDNRLIRANIDPEINLFKGFLSGKQHCSHHEQRFSHTQSLFHYYIFEFEMLFKLHHFKTIKKWYFCLSNILRVQWHTFIDKNVIKMVKAAKKALQIEYLCIVKLSTCERSLNSLN